ncbi:MAG: hypothetical protein IBX50_16395 [Marinospirillum sp.]|uniref:hypothetical protein n=1 Tax=Marinospirillum sp. TaxID=2183934 RepID=UPI0019EFBB66|nr:hypothetical protein [Marinospirillum sp.]MBE0508270.1 hypothetical protein [Marinospirillum sp.]
MNAPPNHNNIESNLLTFADKYILLLSDIHKGLLNSSQSKTFSKQISGLADIIQSLQSDNYAAAAKTLPNADLEVLFDQQFSDNIKLNSDISVLKTRFMNLGILEADASHYL